MSGLHLGVIATFVGRAKLRNAATPENAQQIQKLKSVWALRLQPKKDLHEYLDRHMAAFCGGAWCIFLLERHCGVNKPFALSFHGRPT